MDVKAVQMTTLAALRKEAPPERPKVSPTLASQKRANPLVKNEKIMKAIQATRREKNKLLDRRGRIGGGCEFNSSTTAMVERTVSL
ncbi:hypothetical protein BGW80DRAFT_1278248 [Lactifluus volemus]|nr:hypothetical protein BGW80DRAFT_1278248 [Lactifluus volemus]